MKCIVWEGGVPWEFEGHVAGFDDRIPQTFKEEWKEISHIRMKRLRKGNRPKRMRRRCGVNKYHKPKVYYF